eukprot:scpid100596/ scgid17814/ 
MATQMSNPFAFPCAANTRALIYFCWARTRTIVLAQQWLAGFRMNSGHFFEPRGLSNCFSFSHFGVMRARLGLCSGDILSRNGSASPIFSKDSTLFGGSKACQNNGRTTLRLPY